MALSPEEIDQLGGSSDAQPAGSLSLTATQPGPAIPPPPTAPLDYDTAMGNGAPKKPLSPQEVDAIPTHWTQAPIPPEPPLPEMADTRADVAEYKRRSNVRNLQLKGAGVGVVPLETPLEPAGRLVAKAGEGALATAADISGEIARPMEPEEGRSEHFENIRALFNGEQLPVKGAIQNMTGVGRYAAMASAAVPEMLPRVGLAAALGPEGFGVMSAPVATATAFSATENGFDPLQGLIVAGIGPVAKMGGDLAVGALDSAGGQAFVRAALGEPRAILNYSLQPDGMVRMALESQYRGQPWLTPQTIQQAAGAMGSTGAANLYLNAIATAQAAGGPPGTFMQNVKDAYANNLALSALAIPEIIKGFKADQSAWTSDQVRRTFTPEQQANLDNVQKLVAMSLKSKTPEGAFSALIAGDLSAKHGIQVKEGTGGMPWNPTFNVFQPGEQPKPQEPNAPRAISDQSGLPTQPQNPAPVGQPQPAGGAGGGGANPAGQPAPVPPTPATPVPAAPPSPVAANVEKAAADTNPAPTPAQAESGNYKKGKVTIPGLPPIMIENPKGSVRSGVDAGGKPWSVTMPDHYGYFTNTEAKDGDEVDVHIGPNPDSDKVFVVDQNNLQTGKFDEPKTFVGYDTKEQAVASYNAGFSDGKGPRRIGAVTETTKAGLKEWMDRGVTKKPFAETKPVKSETVTAQDIGNNHAAQSLEQEQAGGTRQWLRSKAAQTGQSVEDFYTKDKATRDKAKSDFRKGLKEGDVLEVSGDGLRIGEKGQRQRVRVVKRFRVEMEDGRMVANPIGDNPPGTVGSGLEPDSGMHFFNELNARMEGGELLPRTLKVISPKTEPTIKRYPNETAAAADVVPLKPGDVAPVRFDSLQQQAPHIGWYEPTKPFKSNDGGIYYPAESGKVKITSGQLERAGFKIPPEELEKFKAAGGVIRPEKQPEAQPDVITIFRGEGSPLAKEKFDKLPEHIKAYAGEWFTESEKDAANYAATVGGKIRSISIPRIEAEKYRIAELNEFRIPKEVQDKYSSPASPNPSQKPGRSMQPKKAPLPAGQSEISKDQALAICGGSNALLPKPGETKVQPSDATGEYHIGQTKDGRYFTQHIPKPVTPTTSDLVDAAKKSGKLEIIPLGEPTPKETTNEKPATPTQSPAPKPGRTLRPRLSNVQRPPDVDEAKSTRAGSQPASGRGVGEPSKSGGQPSQEGQGGDVSALRGEHGAATGVSGGGTGGNGEPAAASPGGTAVEPKPGQVAERAGLEAERDRLTTHVASLTALKESFDRGNEAVKAKLEAFLKSKASKAAKVKAQNDLENFVAAPFPQQADLDGANARLEEVHNALQDMQGAPDVEHLLSASVPDVTQARARVREVDRQQADLRDQYRKLQDQIKEIEKTIKSQRGSSYSRSLIKASAKKSDVARYRELQQQASTIDNQIHQLDESSRADRRAIDEAVDQEIIADRKQPMLRRLDRAYRLSGGKNPELTREMLAQQRRVVRSKYPDATPAEVKTLGLEINRIQYHTKDDPWKALDAPNLYALRRAQLDAAVNAPNVPKSSLPEELTDKLNRFRAGDRPHGGKIEPNAPVEDLSAQQLAELKKDIQTATAKIQAENKAAEERRAVEAAVEEARQEELLKEAQKIADSAGKPGVAGGRTAKEVRDDLVSRIKTAIDEVIAKSDIKLDQAEDGSWRAVAANSNLGAWGEIEPTAGGKFKVNARRFDKKETSLTVVMPTEEDAKWVIRAMVSSADGRAVIGVPGDGVFRLNKSGDTLLALWKDAKALDTGAGGAGGAYTTSGGAEKPPKVVKTEAQWKEAKEYHGLEAADKIHDWSPALLELAKRIDPEHPEVVTTQEVDNFIEQNKKPKDGEKEGSLATGEERPGIILPPRSAKGEQSIREMLTDPNNGLSPEVRAIAAKAMEIPGLDWDRMTTEILPSNGVYQGAAYVKQTLIRITQNANPETMPHEVMHFLWYLLPKEYRDAIEASRVEAIKKMFGDSAPAELLSGKMSSDDYSTAEWIPDDAKKAGVAYNLINAREYFAGYGGERFANENAEPDGGDAGKPKGWWQTFADKVKGWIKALVDLFRKKGANEKAYDDLMAGKFKPDPKTGAAIEDVAERSLVRSSEEYERRQALGELGTAEGTAAAYGSLAKMKYEVAKGLNASDRTMAILNIPRQQALAAMATHDTGLESYYEVREKFAKSSPYIRAEIALSAYHLLGIEQRKSLNIQDKAAKQAAKVTSPGFLQDLKRMVAGEQKLEALQDAEETFKGQVAQQAADIIKKLDERKMADAQAEQLATDLKRVRSMTQFSQAVTQRVQQIVDMLSSHPEGLKLLLYGSGKGSGNELANRYFTMSSAAGNTINNSDERAFVQLASQVLAANRDMARTLSLLSFSKDNPAFMDSLNDVGKLFAKKLEKNPQSAVNWLIRTASKVTEARTSAEAAWVMLHRRVLRQIENYNDLQKAVQVDAALKEQPAWRKLVNDVHTDAKGVKFPDKVIKDMTSDEGFQEFESSPTLLSPTGNAYKIKLGATKQEGLDAWQSVKSYLNELDDWMREPKNANSVDRNFWQSRRDFVEAVYYVSTTTRPSAIEPLGIAHSFYMPDYLWDQSQLPAAKVCRMAFENFGASYNFADGWVHNFQEQIVNTIALAAASHGYSKAHELRQYQTDVLNQMGYLARNGQKLAVGDVLDNGIEINQRDINALKTQGTAISKLINSVRNIGREKVMQDRLLLDQFTTGVFGVRGPHELGGEEGTTLPHQFSDRGKVLARIISGMMENGASREDITSVLNQANNFDFVRTFLAQRKASFVKTLSPFEEQYKELARFTRDQSPDAPQSVEDVVDYIDAHTDEEMDREEVQSQVLGEMTDRLRNFYKKYVEPNKNDAMRVWRTESSSALTRGFVADAENSFFYDYGLVTDGDMRAMANDASNYHLVRVDKALESYENEVVGVLDALKNAPDKAKFKKEAKARHEAGTDFANFDKLESQLQQIRDFRQAVPSWSGNKTVEAALVRRGSRLLGDFISSRLTSVTTAGRILYGSTIKIGQVFAAADRTILLSTARGIASMALSTFKLVPSVGVLTLAKLVGNSPDVMRAIRRSEGGIDIRVAEVIKAALQGVTEEVMRPSSYLREQYKLGLITDGMLGHRMADMIMMPESRGRGYEPAKATNKVVAIPKRIAHLILTAWELKTEVLSSYLPKIAYNIAYEAAARQAGWTLDLLEAAARRAFDIHEKMGTLERFNLDDPSDPRNVLYATEVLPRGLAPKTQTDLAQVREWFRAIDQPYDESVIKFWKKLSQTAKGERKGVHLLGEKDEAQRRAAALMAVSLRDVHHAAPTNRPWILRQVPLFRVINPIIGWSTQTTRQWESTFGSAPHDPEHGKAYLRALTLVYIAAAFGISALIGDQDRRGNGVLKRIAYNEQDSVKHLGQGQTTGENVKIALSAGVSYISLLQTVFNSILGMENTRGGMNFSPMILTEVNGLLSLVQGMAHTKDLSYGVAQFLGNLEPILKIGLNRLPSQAGLVEDKNARNIMTKYGPEDLLRNQGGSGYDVPVPTPLTPYKQTLANAIFSGDQSAIQQAFDAFTAKAQEIGRPQPQKLANEVFESLNPYRQVFGTVLSDAQRQSMLDNMSPGERATIQNVEERYQQAGASLGERTAMTKEDVQQGRQGGGGAVGGPSVPNFSQIQPQAPGMRLSRSTGFKGSGSGGRTIGAVRGVRSGASRSFVGRRSVVGSAKARLGSGVRSMVRSGVSRGSGGTGRPRTLRR